MCAFTKKREKIKGERVDDSAQKGKTVVERVDNEIRDGSSCLKRSEILFAYEFFERETRARANLSKFYRKRSEVRNF